MSIQYDIYLYEHCDNVIKGLQWMRDHIPEAADPSAWALAMEFANMHDSSKWSDKEYSAYDNYFYGSRSYEVVKAFNLAWLHHIHKNPHHWQYWILFEDDPLTEKPYKVLEMPMYDILHMIADWWTFSWRFEQYGEIFQWYDRHKDKMILHPATKAAVELILFRYLKPALIKEGMIQEPGAAEIIEVPVPTDIPDCCLENDLVHSESENDDDEKKFGVPELKKFPMPDKDHVRSAIRFFNYVDPKYEKELAEAILERMKEYGMSFENFGVGDENRFKRYIPNNELESMEKEK